MLNILIVEDDSQLATTLKYLVEDNPRYSVVAIAEDAEGAVLAADAGDPHIALVDLQLARGTTGFAAALRLGDRGIPSLFVSGKPPSFPMPDLALGCLLKPFTAEDVHRALAMAEDFLRGRETHRKRLPGNFRLYSADDGESSDPPPEIEAPFVPGKLSLRTRLTHWIAAQQR